MAAHAWNAAKLRQSNRHSSTGSHPPHKHWFHIGLRLAASGIPNPYFYITAYPLPDGLTDTPLPGDAYWHTTGFTGAILVYESLINADEPDETLLNFLRTVQQAGTALMQ